MSTKLKRLLRKSNQSSESLLNQQGKSVLLTSTKKCKTNCSSVLDFQSETVSSSSPIRVDKKSEKKVRRKRIRSTQDFNQLSSSLTEDSDSSTKTKTKRTKKTKGIYHLPKIDVVEDSIPGSLPSITLNTEATTRRKSRRKRCQSEKSYNEEKDHYSDDMCSKIKQSKQEKKTTRIKSERNLASDNTPLVNKNTFDSEMCNGKMKNNNLEQNSSDKVVTTGQCQSENFISGDQTHSESSFEGDSIIKSKKTLRKKVKSVLSRKSRDTCTKTNISYCSLSSEATDINNPSSNESSIKFLNKTRLSQDQRSFSGRLRAQQTDVNDTQQSKVVHDFIVLNSKGNKEEKDDHKQLILLEKRNSNLNRSGRTFIDTAKQEGEFMEDMKEKRNKISIRSKSLASNLNTSPVKSKKQKKRSIDTFEFLANKEFDNRSSENSIALLNLDDVFDEPSVVEEKYQGRRVHKRTNAECNLDNSAKMEAVHFDSPIEKLSIRRDTFNVEEGMFDLTKLKSMSKSPKYRNSSIYNQTSPTFCLSQNSTKCNGTLEVDKSLVPNQSDDQNNSSFEMTPLKINVSTDKSFLDKSLGKNTTENRVVDVTDSKERKVLKSKRKDSIIELSSPIYGISLTPLEKDAQKDSSENFVVSTNMLTINSKNVTSPEDSNTRSKSFQMDKNVSLNCRQSVIDLITPETSLLPKSSHKNSSVICLQEPSSKKAKKDPVTKLKRQSTFTRTSEIAENELKVVTPLKLNSPATAVKDDGRKKSLFDNNCISPLRFDISNVNSIDSSKVNKRKRWDKSRASVSFLDTTNIENISAPWNEVLDAGNLSSRKTIFQSPIANRTSINRTPPSNTSTPYVNSKNVSLRQALLRSRQNVTLNTSKNLSKAVEKPVTKSTRRKMPNFALIHQRAYDKMENLKEMSERKAIRAKLLLSGYKPTDQNTLKSPSKSKKFLKFSPVKSTTVPLSVKENSKRAENSKCNILVTKIKNISPSTSNVKVSNKENKLTLLEKKKIIKPSQIPKPKVTNNIPEKKGLTRYGFKIGSNNAKSSTKEEQMKAIVNKTKIMKNTVEERRTVVQGVRTNRRFELLMRMRNK